MSTPREQGLAALKEGNLDRAVDFLVQAVLANDNDIEAKALLGIAYSQKGVHVQAKRALQTAVEREPQNQNYRFNLAVVMERAGDLPGAAGALRDLLQVNPQHAQARAKLQAMGPAGAQALAQAGGPAPAPPGAAPAPGMPPTAPPGYAPPPPPGMGAPPAYGAPPGYGQPPVGAPPGYGQPPMGAPPIGGPPPIGAPLAGGPPIGGPPMGAPPMGAPPMGAPPMGAPPMGGPPGYGAPPAYAAPGMAGGGMAPPGTVQCPGCGQFARVGMLCEFCNSPLPPPPRNVAPPPTAYGAPPMGGPTFAGAHPPGFGPQQEEAFSLGGGFSAWLQTLISPKAFFQEQMSYTGLQGPLAFLLAYMLVATVVGGLVNVMGSGRQLGGPYMVGVLIGLVVGSACGWVLLTLAMFIWSGIVHLACKIFGGQGDYPTSFRAATYAMGPLAAVNLIATLLTPVLGGTTPTRVTTPREAAIYAANVMRSEVVVLAQAPPSGPLGQGAPTFPGRPSSGPNPMDLVMSSQAMPLLILRFIALIWGAAVLAIGISELHQVGIGRAIGAVVVSGVILTGLMFLLVFLLWASIMSAIGSLRPR